MTAETIRGPRMDGKMIVGFANSLVFGFYVRGQRVKGLLQKKLDELAYHRAIDVSVYAPIGGCTDGEDEGRRWGDLLPDDRALPDAELEGLRAETAQRLALDGDLRNAIDSLAAVIDAMKKAVERETVAGILSYAQACADRGEPALLSSVGIEMVTREGQRDLVDGVRLGRCLGKGPMGTTVPSHEVGGVRLVPKQNWKTSKKLEAFLHEQPDTTIEWASASQASIHKRIIRAIPLLEEHALITDMLFHEEDL